MIIIRNAAETNFSRASFSFILSNNLDTLFFAEFQAHFLQLELLDFAGTRQRELVDEEHVFRNLLAG